MRVAIRNRNGKCERHSLTRSVLAILLVFLFAADPATLLADVLVTNSGRRLEGKFLRISRGKTVIFRTRTGVERVPLNRVASMKIDRNRKSPRPARPAPSERVKKQKRPRQPKREKPEQAKPEVKPERTKLEQKKLEHPGTKQSKQPNPREQKVESRNKPDRQPQRIREPRNPGWRARHLLPGWTQLGDGRRGAGASLLGGFGFFLGLGIYNYYELNETAARASGNLAYQIYLDRGPRTRYRRQSQAYQNALTGALIVYGLHWLDLSFVHPGFSARIGTRPTKDSGAVPSATRPDWRADFAYDVSF